MANYSKSTEVSVSASVAIAMMNDPELVVVMAIPNEPEDRVDVTYWLKDDSMLPPWILTKKAV